MFARLILFLAVIVIVNQSAFAAISVKLQVNKTEAGYRIIFLGMDKDFSVAEDENNQFLIKLKEPYVFQDIKDLEALRDVFSKVTIRDQALLLALKSPAIKLIPVRQHQVFGVDLIIDSKKTIEDSTSSSPANIIESASLSLNSKAAESILTYESSSIVSAAAFTKGKHIFIAFSGVPQKIAIPSQFNDFIADIEQLGNINNGVVFKITLHHELNGVFPHIRRDVNKWHLMFSPKQLKTSEIRVYSKPEASPAPRVEVLVEEDGGVIYFEDPPTKERYIAITKEDDLSAVGHVYNYIDFKILQSFQGVIIKPISDGLEIEDSDESIYIQKKNMLNISKKFFMNQRRYEDNLETFKMGEFVKEYSAILSLKYYYADDQKFLISKSIIRKAINAAKTAEDRTKLYANLALFYLANDFYEEALGIIYVLHKEAPEFANSYNMQIIEMASLILIGKLDEASKLANKISIIDVPISLRKEVRFWQSLAFYNDKTQEIPLKKLDMVKVFFESRNFMNEYTEDIRLRLALILLDHKLQEGNTQESLKLLKFIDEIADKSSKDKNTTLFYFGQYYALLGDANKAEKYFDSCSQDLADAMNCSRCLFEKAKLDLQLQKITKRDYANKLETILMLWHGDDLEIKMLKSLGETYDDLNDELNMLRAFNKIVAYNLYLPISIELSEKMSKSFYSYFTENEPEKRDHLEALSVFYEFQKFLPIGDRGDEVVLSFADHLIALDLLDRAAAILNHQITYRLGSYKREEAINKLAIVHNNNRQPYYAIEVIKSGDPMENLPDVLAEERKYILANAYFLNFQDDECLAVLANDYSQTADDIKAGLYWRQGNWDGFLNYAEPRIYELRKTTNQISQLDSMRVIKVAIAYLMTNNYPLLKALASDFANRIPSNTPAKELFATLTDSWQSIYQNNIASQELINRVEALSKELSSNKPLLTGALNSLAK